MNNVENVDIVESNILKFDRRVLDNLLLDRTTGKNIIWGTDDYKELGPEYAFNAEIKVELITGDKDMVIRPRAIKTREEQYNRTKNMAEVFTPTWLCNRMNNLADAEWFGREDVFNKEIGTEWIVIEDKVEFPNPAKRGKGSWWDYLHSKRLEFACGEAPYLASRYDTTTGEMIEIGRRVGFLDRKFRIIDERARKLSDRDKAKSRWKELAMIVLKSIYGYDWQGDNVLLARENLLFSAIDYYKKRFNEYPSVEVIIDFAIVISWNIWQMDGLKMVVPNSCYKFRGKAKKYEPDIFDAKENSIKRLKRVYSPCEINEEVGQECQGCLKNDIYLHNGIYCKIKDWSTGKIIEFKDLSM